MLTKLYTRIICISRFPSLQYSYMAFWIVANNTICLRIYIIHPINIQLRGSLITRHTIITSQKPIVLLYSTNAHRCLWIIDRGTYHTHANSDTHARANVHILYGFPLSSARRTINRVCKKKKCATFFFFHII